MSKKIYTIILAVMLCSIVGTSAFAAENVNVENKWIDSGITTNNDAENNVDILVEDFSRGTKAPTAYKNISGTGYNFSGTYAYALYTNYYFSPNSSGKLKIRASTTWPDQYTVQKGMTIKVIEKSSKKTVKTCTATTTKMSDTSQLYNWTASGTWTVSGLDKDKFYYLYISKTSDGEECSLSGTVSWP